MVQKSIQWGLASMLLTGMLTGTGGCSGNSNEIGMDRMGRDPGFILLASLYTVAQIPEKSGHGLHRALTFEGQVWESNRNSYPNPYRHKEDARKNIVTAREECIRAWHRGETGKYKTIRRVLSAFPSDEHMDITAQSPDGRYRATTTREGCVLLRDITLDKTRTLKPGRWLACIAFDPDSSRLVCVDAYGGCSIWRVGDGTLFLKQALKCRATAVEFAPSGEAIVIYSPDSFPSRNYGAYYYVRPHAIRRFAISPDALLEQKDLALDPTSLGDKALVATAWAMAIRPDGKRVVTGHEDALLVEWDVETRKAIGAYASKLGEVLHIKYAPDGKTVILTTAPAWDLYRWVPGSKTHAVVSGGAS
jgi:hypothetical protein